MSVGLPRARARGFTLVEVAITVAILALAVGVVLAEWGSSKAELRKTSAMLVGTVRAAYDEAALTGLTYRLVFSFEKSVVRVEATEQLLAFADGEGPVVRGGGRAASAGPFGAALSGLMSAGLGGDQDEDIPDTPPDALVSLLGNRDDLSGEGGATFSSTDHDLELGGDVHLLDVWIRGMHEPASKGEIYLYFFPHGYTQDAIVHLEDREGRVFSVRVAALTGRGSIAGEYLEIPE